MAKQSRHCNFFFVDSDTLLVKFADSGKKHKKQQNNFDGLGLSSLEVGFEEFLLEFCQISLFSLIF